MTINSTSVLTARNEVTVNNLLYLQFINYINNKRLLMVHAVYLHWCINIIVYNLFVQEIGIEN